MAESYLARYRDNFGKETTTILNNGQSLLMLLRGIKFQGTMLDDWAAEKDADPAKLTTFTLQHNELCQYALDFEMFIPVVEGGEILQGMLRVHLEVGSPKPNGTIDREDLQLELLVRDKSFRSCGKHGWFDDELQEINHSLPPGMFIKSCHNCAYSDYNPAGYGIFGCPACFRNTKQEYLSLKGKAAYFKLCKSASLVQETFLCEEFEKRGPGTGYRG